MISRRVEIVAWVAGCTGLAGSIAGKAEEEADGCESVHVAIMRRQTEGVYGNAFASRFAPSNATSWCEPPTRGTL